MVFRSTASGWQEVARDADVMDGTLSLRSATFAGAFGSLQWGNGPSFNSHVCAVAIRRQGEPGGSPSPTVTGLTATPNPATVPVGGSGQITVTVQGTNSPPQTVTAALAPSAATGVATSNAAGVVTAAQGATAGQTTVIRYTSTLDTSKYVDVGITLAAVAPPPTAAIGVAPIALAFAATQGGTAPAAKTVSVSNTGPNGTTLNATVAKVGTIPWLAFTFAGGTITASVTPGTLAPGTYEGVLRVSDAAASNSPVDVPVIFTVTTPTASPVAPSPDFPLSGVLQGYARTPSAVVTLTPTVSGVCTVQSPVVASATATAPGSGLYAYSSTVTAIGSAAIVAVVAKADGHDPTAYAVSVKAAPTG